MRYVRDLDADAVLEATRQTFPFWGTGRTQAEHTAHNLAQLEAAGPDLLRYVGLVDARGALVASLKRFTLPLSGGRRAVGIGAVFTSPDHRRGGAARRLIEAVLREADDLGFDAGILYSDIAPEYYERLGFVRLPALEYVGAVVSLPTENAYSVRHANDADLDRLMAFHRAEVTASPAVLRFERTRSTFRYFDWRNRTEAPFILSDGANDIGYVMTGLQSASSELPEAREPSLFWVDEWAGPGADPTRVWATIRVLATAAGGLFVGTWQTPDSRSPLRPRARTAAFPLVAPLGGRLHVDLDRAHFASFEHF